MSHFTTPADTAEGKGSESPRQGAESAALDNNAKSSGNRLDRWAARGTQWEYSELPRVKKCGRVVITSDGTVGVRANGESVGYAGLHTCGSVWACPVCNAKIQSVRRLEVGVALASVHANGGGAAFGAITVRHHAGQRLGGLLDALTYGIARIGQDKTVRRLRVEMGYVGSMQALEFTIGRNGWHPHRHPLPIFDRPCDPDQLIELHFAQLRAFAAGVEARGYESPTALGNVLKPIELGDADTLSDYFTKSTYTADGVAWEATSTQTKKGRAGGRTPWQLLDSVRINGDADDLELWNEYELATKGKRALTFSRGLREKLGLNAERSDESIADEEVGDETDTGFRVLSWAPIVQNPLLGAGLLNAVTPAGNWNAGREFAWANGITIGDNE